MLPILHPDFLLDLAAIVNEHIAENEENEESGNTTSSYYHFISDRFENGKKVSHKEKEIRDGKVLKNISQSTAIEDKAECEEFHRNGDEEKSANGDANELSVANTILKSKVEELEILLKEKADDYSELLNENKVLRDKLENIKKLF